MTRFLSALGLVWLAVVAPAQVTVELQFDQEQFLRGEPVALRVRISNFSGQALRLGEEADWLAFTVTGSEGKSIRQTANLPVTKPFTVESAKSVVMRAELTPYFNLETAGQYGVTARIRVPQLDKEFSAAAKRFDTVSGATIWEKEVGVPGTTPTAVRRYALQRASTLKQTWVYAQLTDGADGRLLRVVPLGVLTSFSQPEAAVDRASQLHAIFQNGQNVYSYAIITPDGDQIIRQSYEIVGSSRPRLRVEADGRIIVHGGTRKITSSDLPPPPRVPSTNDVAQGK